MPSSRLLPTLTAAALACATVAFAPATTARPDTGVPYLAEDPAGDANALNGQGVEDLDGVSTGPAQYASADLLGARVTSQWRALAGPDGDLTNVLTGLEFRTALSALPTEAGPALLHRFRGMLGGCDFWVQLSVGTGGPLEHGTATLRRFGTGCGVPDDSTTGLEGNETTPLPGFAVDLSTGEAVVATPIDALPAALADEVVPGAFYVLDGLEVRHHTAAGITAPVLDELDGAGAAVRIGDDVPPYDGPSRDEVCAGREGESGSAEEPIGDDRTGIGGSTLTLGLHAPATGASPLPTTSLEHAADLYWRTLTETCDTDVAGRTNVEVVVADDQYDPNSASRACSDLASRAFLVAGVSGVDQLHRCATIADAAAFPYLAPGTTMDGHRGNPWFFPTSMSWRQQGGLLAAYVAANPHDLAGLGPDAVLGTVRLDLVTTQDAEQGWLDGLAAEGLDHAYVFRHTRGDRSWFQAAGREFRDRGVTAVYVLTDPVTYLDMAQTWATTLDYRPRFVGVDADLARDAVLAAGCHRDGEVDGGVFLSSTPGLDRAPAGFLDAAARFDTPADDVALRLWGLAEAQHALLRDYAATFGADLTREQFRAHVEDGGGFDDGTYPGLTYRVDDHFGGTAMHVLMADCAMGSHVTLAEHARGF